MNKYTQAQIEATKLLDEVIGYARANAEAARTNDDCMTWRAHQRNCEKVQAVITAAAKIEEQLPTKFPHGRLLVNATIEQCAQVAKKRLEELELPRAAILVVDTIRALKDQP